MYNRVVCTVINRLYYKMYILVVNKQVTVKKSIKLLLCFVTDAGAREVGKA